MGPVSVGGFFLIFRYFFGGILTVFYACRKPVKTSGYRTRQEYFAAINRG